MATSLIYGIEEGDRNDHNSLIDWWRQQNPVVGVDESAKFPAAAVPMMILKSPNGWQSGRYLPLMRDALYPFSFDVCLIGYPAVYVNSIAGGPGFKLNWNGIETERIPFNATADQLRDKLPPELRDRCKVTGGLHSELIGDRVVNYNPGRWFISLQEPADLLRAVTLTPLNDSIVLRVNQSELSASRHAADCWSFITRTAAPRISIGSMALGWYVQGYGLMIGVVEPRIFEQYGDGLEVPPTTTPNPSTTSTTVFPTTTTTLPPPTTTSPPPPPSTTSPPPPPTTTAPPPTTTTTSPPTTTTAPPTTTTAVPPTTTTAPPPPPTTTTTVIPPTTTTAVPTTTTTVSPTTTTTPTPPTTTTTVVPSTSTVLPTTSSTTSTTSSTTSTTSTTGTPTTTTTAVPTTSTTAGPTTTTTPGPSTTSTTGGPTTTTTAGPTTTTTPGPSTTTSSVPTTTTTPTPSTTTSGFPTTTTTPTPSSTTTSGFPTTTSTTPPSSSSSTIVPPPSTTSPPGSSSTSDPGGGTSSSTISPCGLGSSVWVWTGSGWSLYYSNCPWGCAAKAPDTPGFELWEERWSGCQPVPGP